MFCFRFGMAPPHILHGMGRGSGADGDAVALRMKGARSGFQENRFPIFCGAGGIPGFLGSGTGKTTLHLIKEIGYPVSKVQVQIESIRDLGHFTGHAEGGDREYVSFVNTLGKGCFGGSYRLAEGKHIARRRIRPGMLVGQGPGLLGFIILNVIRNR